MGRKKCGNPAGKVRIFCSLKIYGVLELIAHFCSSILFMRQTTRKEKIKPCTPPTFKGGSRPPSEGFWGGVLMFHSFPFRWVGIISKLFPWEAFSWGTFSLNEMLPMQACQTKEHFLWQMLVSNKLLRWQAATLHLRIKLRDKLGEKWFVLFFFTQFL